MTDRPNNIDYSSLNFRMIRPKRGRHIGSGPAVTINKDGHLTMTADTFEAMGEPGYIAIGIDTENNILMLQPTDADDPLALPFGKPTQGRRRLNANQVLRELGLKSNVSYKYPVASFGPNQEAYINLSGPKSDVSRER